MNLKALVRRLKKELNLAETQAAGLRSAIRALEPGRAPAVTSRPTMSAAARRKISAAQKARWKLYKRAA